MYDDISILPNILSDYASSSYSLTLYSVNRDEFTREENNRTAIFTGEKSFNKKIIFAESASTSMQITNLSLQTFPLKFSGSFITTMSMTLNYVRGTGLEDGVFAASKILNWKNPAEMRFFLEIKFLGRKQENEESKRIETITVPIVFSSVNLNLDYSGTVYTISAALSSSLPNDFSYSKLPQNITISAGNNLQNFFDNLALELNRIENNKIDKENVSIPQVQHSFVIDERFKNSSITGVINSDSTVYTGQAFFYNGGSTVTLSNGSTIPSFIDDILSNTPEVQSMLVDEEDFAYTHVIEPQTVLNGFDPLSGKETLHIQWNINATRKRKPSKNTTPEDTIFTKSLEGISSIKLYDYYHTGTNTEVKDISFQTEKLYHSKIAQYGNMELRRPNSNYATYPTNNAEPFEQNKAQSRNPAYEPNWETNSNGENVLYLDDLNIKNYLYTLFEPKVIYNYTEINTASDQNKNQKNMQYLFDLEFIRNASSASFLSAEVKIKGDPFWILPPMKQTLKSTLSRSSSTENMAIIRFIHPSNEMYEGNKGDYKNNIYSGYYYVVSVESVFNNGKFEQTLRCMRDPRISAMKIQALINEKGR